MRLRALGCGLLVVLLSCAGSDKPVGGGEAGQATTGGAGGSGNGGTSQGGDAGDDQGGSSGTSQGGAGGSAGDSVAGTGGQDEGTVTGVVRTYSGSPNENVLIAIGSATTMTDRDGRFEIPDVPLEYDLVLIAAPESYALVIRGISERALSLSAPGYDNPHGANIAGVVTGGAGTPVPADCVARAAFQGSSIEVSGLFGADVFLNVSDASYAIDPFWYGPASVSGFLYALEYRRDAMSRAISYDGFGSKPFGISDRGVYGLPDGSIPATTIALAPVASRTVSGTVTVPPGSFHTLEFSVGPFQTDFINDPEGTYSAVLPTGLAGIRNLVTLSAERIVEPYASKKPPANEISYATFLIDDAMTTLDLSTLESVAVSILPAEGAVGVDHDTQFSWEPPADSVSMLLFIFATWRVSVVTDASSATIPDLTEYGVSQESGTGLWTVGSAIGPTNVDEWLRFTADPAAYLNAHGKIEGTSGVVRTFNLAN